MKLGQFIKEWRKKNKVTQEELATAAGVTKGYISQLENDYKPNGKDSIIPTYTVLKGFAKAMNIDINTFLNAVDTEISLVKEPTPITPSRPAYPEFKTAQEAIKYILEFPMVAQFGGYDLDTMSDEELIDMANLVAQLIRGVAVSNESRGGSDPKEE